MVFVRKAGIAAFREALLQVQSVQERERRRAGGAGEGCAARQAAADTARRRSVSRACAEAWYR